MSKRKSNKRVKQMIFDVAMQGRKLFWYGEESEIFIAKSAKDVKAEYFDPTMDDDEQECEQITTNWRSLWKPIGSEEPVGGAKLAKGSDYIYAVPWISFVGSYSPMYPAPCMSTSYN